MFTPFVLAVTVFLASYALIISEKIHRTVVAIGGATLLVILGVLHQHQAVEGVDFNTLGLLIGMMVIVTVAKDSGIFQYVALWTAKVSKGHPKRIYLLLGLITALFSALLDNVTTVLLLTPVTFVIANNFKLNPKPFLFNIILLSNIGGAATLIGDPPNILIGSAEGISFNEFLVNMAPISAVITLIVSGLLLFVYRNQLIKSPDVEEHLKTIRPSAAITNFPLLYKSLGVLAIVLAGFFTHSMTHLEGATIALAGAALMLLVTMKEPEEPLKEVEWTTIFFFIGLFILVTGLEEVGAIHMLAEHMIELTGGDQVTTTLVILWSAGIFSAIIDNIPFVATMIPLIQNIGEISPISTTPLWWALALGADFGGNATIIGASANLVVAGIAEKNGYKIGFLEYMKTAVPITLVALLLSTVYVYFRYL